MRRLSLLIFALAVFACGCRQQTLQISSAEPKEFTGGESRLIDIKGQGFQPGAGVWFGDDLSPQAVVVSPERIIALTPKSVSSGARDLKVMNPDGQSATLAKAALFKSRLALAEVDPAFVPESVSGIEVKVRGQGFMEGAKVFFGPTESPAVNVKDESFITAQLPALGLGVMDVKVKNPDAAEASLFDGFQVLGAGQQMPLKEMKEDAESWGMAGVELDNDTGIGVADVNQDGFLDCVITTGRMVSLMIGSREGKFKNATLDSGLEKVIGITYGAYFGDLDNDDRPDLIITGRPTHLFHNLGAAKFEDVSQRVGLSPDLRSWCAVWLDYDRDGLLDLYISTPTEDDYLFHNDSGKLVRAFPDLFLKRDLAKEYNNGQPSSFSAAAADYDNDGYPDLFIGIRGLPSRLYHNLAGKGFEDVTIAAGIGTNPPPPEKRPIFKPNWGVSWADFDNDGYLDLFTNSGPLGADLYRNREGKSFVNVTDRMRVRLSENNLMTAWGDFDNDGLEDMAVGDNLSGVRVYRNLGDGSFQEVTPDLGIVNVPRNSPMGVVWLDLNRDGALDLFTVEYMTWNRFFENSPYPGRHYLEVELTGRKSNASAIGAVVTVQAGNTLLTRQVSGGEGYLVEPSPILHFGLGNMTKVDKLTVRWPAGDPQVMEDVPADQVLTIIETGERKVIQLPPEPAPAPGSTVTPGVEAAPGKTVK